MIQTAAAPKISTSTNSRDAPRLILVGLPDSGKTSVLGALARCSEIQERQLEGRLYDDAQGLRELRRCVYEGLSERNRGVPSSYSIRFEPFDSSGLGVSPTDSVHLVESDSRKINELLSASPDAKPGSFARLVRGADGVLIVIDAAAPAANMESTFVNALIYLRALRAERGRSAEVAELPVWLVLTKCDKLARRGDTLAIWTERVEAAKEIASQRFSEFLQRSPEPVFGTLDFHTAATAIKHPELSNATGRTSEPFGVAELFRDAIAAARSFNSRRERSNDRLRQVLIVGGLLIAGAAIFAAGVSLKRTLFRPSELQVALGQYRDREGAPPAGHLAHPIAPRVNELVELSQHPEFGRLPSADRSYVGDRLGELREYQDYASKLRTVRPPVDARDGADLDDIESQLRKELAIPDERRDAWAESDAGKTRERMLAEVAAVRQVYAEIAAAYDKQRSALDQLYLRTSDLPWNKWATEVSKALSECERPPFDPNQSVSNWPTAGGKSTPRYAALLDTPPALQSQKRLTTSRQRLSQLRDIASLLGLIPSRDPTLLVENVFTVEQAPGLLAELKKKFPALGQYNLNTVPDKSRSEISDAARQSYAQLLKAGQAAVSKIISAGSVTRTDAADQIASDANLSAWNELAREAQRLAGEDRDPVGELVASLRRDDWPLTIRSAKISLPIDATASPLTPTGSLIVYLQNKQGQTLKTVLKQQVVTSADGDFLFANMEAKPIAFKPGDSLWAELALQDAAGQPWQLSWWGSNSQSRWLQFDRLLRSPKLHRLEQKPEAGVLSEKIKVEFSPTGGIPMLPDLLPNS